MRKHKAQYVWRRLSRVSLWVIAGVFVISVMASIFALRQNNLMMVQLRDKVYAADKQGDNVESALHELRVFVYGHMNTNLRAGSTSSEAPIQLTETYNRLVASEQARVAALGGNAAVYAVAQQKCVDKTVEAEKLQCVQQYLTDNGGNKFQLSLPSKEFYTFDFISPSWSPDLAGFSVLIAAFSAILLVLRLIAGRVLKNYFDA
jgi:hypothetical protein